MDMEIVIFIFVAILVTLLLLKVIFFDKRSQRKVLAQIRAFLNVSLVSTEGYPYLKGEYNGAEIRIDVMTTHHKGRSLGACLSVHMRTEHSFRLNVEKRTIVSVGFIAFGKEVKTSDDQFNKKFVVCANDETAAINYMSDRQKLQAISFLLSNEYASLFNVNGRSNYVTAVKPGYKEKDLNKKRLTAILDHLYLLVR